MGSEMCIRDRYTENLPCLKRIPSKKERLLIEVLTKKTHHWEYEAEYRIVQFDEYYPITNRIKGVYLGFRIRPEDIQWMNNIVPHTIPMHIMGLNPRKVTVEVTQTLNRGK